MVDFNRILVAVDFSAPSKAAAENALDLARKLKSKVDFLHVFDDRPPIGIPGAIVDIPHYAQDVAKNASTQLENFVKALNINGVDVSTRVRAGVPAREILDAAKELGAQLLVLGTHGRTGIARAVLGSQAEMILRRATIPVLVLHSEAQETAA
jgi:nucleotide-binding universal stress UspA family protein